MKRKLLLIGSVLLIIGMLAIGWFFRTAGYCRSEENIRKYVRMYPAAPTHQLVDTMLQDQGVNRTLMDSCLLGGGSAALCGIGLLVAGAFAKKR